jgi:hypothetical protein
MTAKAGARDIRYRGQVGTRRLFMTFATTQFFMGTVQQETRLLGVIEVPCGPASRVMAKIALATQRIFVNIITHMTFGTGNRRIFKGWRLMTRAALGTRMQTGELKTGLTVIVWNTCPLRFVVTTITALAKLAFVSIVFAMA